MHCRLPSDFNKHPERTASSDCELFITEEHFHSDYATSHSYSNKQPSSPSLRNISVPPKDLERIERELARGVWLTRDMLAQRLNMSPAGVFAALRKLETDNIVRKACSEDHVPDPSQEYWTVIPRRHGHYAIEMKSEEGEDIVAFVTARLDANQVQYIQKIQNQLRQNRKKNIHTEEKTDPSEN